MLGEFGKVIEVHNARETSKAYVEHSPDILFMSSEIDIGPNAYLTQKILDHDPKAYIVFMDKDGSAESMLDSVKRGAKSFLLLPTTQQQLEGILKSCPAFSDSFLLNQDL